MGAYFVKNSSSTTAEMSRRGLPIPRRTRSYAIDEICESSEMCFEKERNSGRAAKHKASVGLRGIYTKQLRGDLEERCHSISPTPKLLLIFLLI